LRSNVLAERPRREGEACACSCGPDHGCGRSSPALARCLGSPRAGLTSCRHQSAPILRRPNLAVHADREPSSCGGITGTGHCSGAWSEPPRLVRTSSRRVVSGPCVQDSAFYDPRHEGGPCAVIRCRPLPPLSVQTTAGGALGGNPRALGFCSPPLYRSAPRAARAAKKPRARVLR
jgi:hypothetical protein